MFQPKDELDDADFYQQHFQIPGSVMGRRYRSYLSFSDGNINFEKVL